ncbi:hypothetical protein KUV89_11740 [Marinobacter hydrocarbonoclasticus]|nr:hypothetical protein [Marinobacter nauticus]
MLTAITGCTEKEIVEVPVVQEVLVEVPVVPEEKVMETAFTTSPTFLSAVASDADNRVAEVNGDGTYTFKIDSESIVYPVAFSTLIEEGDDTALAFTLRTHDGQLASPITTFISGSPKHEQAAKLDQLASLTGVDKARLIGNFEKANDIEVAKISRLLYYVISLGQDAPFSEYLESYGGEDSFDNVVSRFIDHSRSEYEGEMNVSQFYRVSQLAKIHDVISSYGAPEAIAPARLLSTGNTSDPAPTDVGDFYSFMDTYRIQEKLGTLDTIGIDLFSDVLESAPEKGFEQAFNATNSYIEHFVVNDEGEESKASFSAEALQSTFVLSARNQAILASDEADIYVSLFNELLDSASQHSRDSDRFYSPDDLFYVLEQLRDTMLGAALYNRTELRRDMANLLGIKLNGSTLDAIRYQLEMGIDAQAWALADYIQFFNDNLLAVGASEFDVTLAPVDGGQVTEASADSGAKAGSVVAYLSAKAFDGKLLHPPGWSVSLMGDDSGLVTLEWNESESRFDVKLTQDIFHSEIQKITLSYIAQWTRYDHQVELSGSTTISINEDPSYFGILGASFKPENPDVDGDNGNKLYVRFNKNIDPISIVSAEFVLSDDSITVSDVAIDPENGDVLTATLSTSDVTVKALQRGKGTKYLYAQGESDSELTEDGLVQSTKFSAGYYSEDQVLLVKVIGIKGQSEDGTLVDVNTENMIPVDRLRYRGIDYELTHSPGSGLVFLAQNLGASSKCHDASVSSDEILPTCRGNYYQVGRVHDGHEIFMNPELPDSEVDTVFGEVDFDTHGLAPPTSAFISTDYYWNTIARRAREDGDDNLTVAQNYFGENSGMTLTTTGVYCPVGYRVPTMNELQTEFKYIDDLVSRDVINNFSESHMYVGNAGTRKHNGELANESGYTMIYTGIGQSNMILRVMKIENMKTYSSPSYQNYNYERSRRGFNMRCVKD